MKQTLTGVGIIATGILLAAVGTAKPSKDSLREQCRKTVAGAYLVTIDEHGKFKEFLTTLVHTQESLRKGQVEAQKHYDILRQRHLDNEFDLGLAREYMGAERKLNLINYNIKENERLIAETKARYEALEKEEQRLRDAIEEVFNIERVQVDDFATYPYQISYKYKCPPYRFSCPLPHKYRRKLIRLRVKGEVPLECQRYATLGSTTD